MVPINKKKSTFRSKLSLLYSRWKLVLCIVEALMDCQKSFLVKLLLLFIILSSLLNRNIIEICIGLAKVVSGYFVFTRLFKGTPRNPRFSLSDQALIISRYCENKNEIVH